jgi:hypothetical protein
MKAAASFLTGKHTSAYAFAQEQGVNSGNVSYYVKLWRGSDVVEEMCSMHCPPPVQAEEPEEITEQQTTEQQQEHEIVDTATDPSMVQNVAKLGGGLGYNNSGTDEARYKACYKWAAAEYLASNKKGKEGPAKEAVGFRAVSKKLSKLSGVFICYQTIRRAVAACTEDAKAASDVTSPERIGFRSPYPEEAEEAHLLQWIQAMRAFKLPIFKSTVMAVADAQIKGTVYQDDWKQGVTNNWYYRFIKSHGLGSGNYRPLELSRAQWTTADCSKYGAALQSAGRNISQCQHCCKKS